ncbi:hypothetical protein K2D_19910 [Planctomycetes bacterium K2D]|nr:hypothetical protein K2D_19910 [Planctomycetes bacterium K2D]
MMITRFPLMALSLTVFVSGFGTTSVSADEGHVHAAGHDHDAMQKAEKKIAEAMSSLSPEDQKQAAAQRFCPMMEYSRLGSMGTPIKLTIEGKPVFVCCKGCIDDANAGGAETVKTTEKLTDASAELAKLSPAERAAAEAQKYCAINTKGFLGSMGAPIKLEIDGKPVYLCCSGCTKRAIANPAATLAQVEELKHAGMKEGHDHGDHK